MATYENIDYGSPDGSIWGETAADKIGFYGQVPIIQRAYTAAVHNTTAIASSTDFAAAQTAALHECMLTFTALGIWATV